MTASLLILPEAWLHTRSFAVASTFVAINTLVYVALALVKLMPVLLPARWLPHHYHRRESRSIYPGVDAGSGRGSRRRAGGRRAR